MRGSVNKTILLSLLMLIPSVIKAECSYSEKSILQSLAGNINFSYNYEETNDDAIFNITINNLNNNIYISDVYKNDIYYDINGEIVTHGYNSGSKLEFKIYSNTDNCLGGYLVTKYVNLPYYNKYYKDPLCKGISNYKLCKKWNNISLSYDRFKNEVTKYKEGLQKNEEDHKIEDNDNIFDKIINFIIEYRIIIGTIIMLIMILIIIYSRKKREYHF